MSVNLGASSSANFPEYLLLALPSKLEFNYKKLKVFETSELNLKREPKHSKLEGDGKSHTPDRTLIIDIVHNIKKVKGNVSKMLSYSLI
jgi:hypothetical protein